MGDNTAVNYIYQPKGLVNCSTYCYFNSLIQSLYSLTLLRNYVLNNEYNPGNNVNYTLLRNMFNDIYNANENTTVDLRKYYSTIMKNGQQDIHETYIKLMDFMEEIKQNNSGAITDEECPVKGDEIGEVNDAYYTDQNHTKIDTYISNPVIFLYSFKIRYSDKMICKNDKCRLYDADGCNFSIDDNIPVLLEKIDNLTSLSISINNDNNKFNNLKEYINNYFDTVEQITDYECKYCKKKVSSVTRQMSMYSYPHIFVIHLNRYGVINRKNSSKINKTIHIPEYMYFYNSGIYYIYRLRTFNSHYGSSTAGHYVSVVNEPLKEKDKTYYNFNDENIKQYNGTFEFITNNKDCIDNAYMIYYELVDELNTEQKLKDFIKSKITKQYNNYYLSDKYALSYIDKIEEGIKLELNNDDVENTQTNSNTNSNSNPTPKLNPKINNPSSKFKNTRQNGLRAKFANTGRKRKTLFENVRK